MTIAFLLVPSALKNHPKRVIRKLYKKYRIAPSTEKKGSDLTDAQRTYFVGQVIKMLNKHPEIKLLSITVNKEKVSEHIRRDANKLYN